MLTRSPWFAGFALLFLTQGAGLQPGGRGTPRPPAPRPPNICKCGAPISAQASGFGACSRTQDNGTFCELNFVSAAVTAAVINDSAFPGFRSKVKMSAVTPDDVIRAVQRVQLNQLAGLRPADVAMSVHATAGVAAFARRNDASALSHFTDILELTNPASVQPQVADILQRYAQPVTGDAATVQTRIVPVRGRQYEIRATPGCVAFLERQFLFTVRGIAEARPCTSDSNSK